ncbi:hypothetical protein GCM10009839_18940 [Catenulispora yoronensis]|uniref:HTH cro/C1-type domain-containing protein n=1 Tax=Catenulispora yoronensis TaxID=450799 RepID=A0ABN2TW77_9ACTN
MGRLEKRLDPGAGPLAQLAVDLRELRRRAGGPTYREMSRVAGYSPSALSAAASGAALPSAGVLSSYVKACGGDVEEWLARRTEVALEEAGHAAIAAPVQAMESSLVLTPALAPALALTLTPALEREPAPDVKAKPAPAVTRRQRFARRGAGLLAAAIVGSLATVVPMAVWGAPSCLSSGHGSSAPAGCHPATAR